jgi:hypothetical protein
MIVLAVLLTALQVFDGWVTYLIIRNGGGEANPVVEWLITKLGLYPALLLLKGIAVILVWVLVLLPGKFNLLGLIVLSIFYLWVAFHNWKVYQK